MAGMDPAISLSLNLKNMAQAKIIKLTEKSTLVSITPNGRQFGSKLAYIRQADGDTVGATIEIADGYTFVDFKVWNPDTDTMEVVTTKDGVVCQTLEWA
jgi:hypothetical protein